MFEIGSRVETDKNGKGTVAFCGKTSFAPGEWIGVILDEPKGKNDGTVQTERYFTCEENHGLFIRATQLKLETPRGAPLSKIPSSNPRRESLAVRGKPSPTGTPKMSPAVSSDKLSKLAIKKPSTSQIPPTSTELKTETHEETVETQSSESVIERAKKIDDVSSPLLFTSVPQSPTSSTEIELLRLQVRDLSEKLETLRVKRKEDNAKLVEYERSKLQLQSLQDLKQRMGDEHINLQRQVAELQKDNEELRNWKTAHFENSSNMGELVEMATIDKEMAEEKAELLQNDVDHMKVRIDELETELALMKEEMEGATGGGGAPAGNSVQIKALEQQNEKLKEGLIKLRDLNGQAVADRKSAVNELELVRLENAELLRIAELAKKQTEEAEEHVRDYQEQVEASLGAEEMILTLSNKNMDLEDQIKKMEQDIEDLEALRDMDEEIAETQKQMEKDLRKDVDALQVRIHELLSVVRQEEDRNSELSHTIVKFRRKTSELNEEIQDYKDQVLRFEEQLTGQKSDEKSMATIANRLHLSAAKAFGELVERELAILELDYCRRQLNLLKAFLPDNFAKPAGDQDCVILSVLLPRMLSKSQMFCKLSSERFPSVPGGMRSEHVLRSHKAEQWAHCCRVTFACNSVVVVCAQLEDSVERLSVESLSRLAQLLPELSAHERSVDSYLELLRQGRFDENTSLDQFDRAVAHFNNFFNVHVGGNDFNGAVWVKNSLNLLLSGFSWIKLNVDRICFLLEPGMECEVRSMAEGLLESMQKCEQKALRSSKEVNTAAKEDEAWRVSAETKDLVQACTHNTQRLAMLLHEACNTASVQVAMNGDGACFEPTRLKELIDGVVNKVMGPVSTDKQLSLISDSSAAICESIETLATNISNGSALELKSVKKSFPPILERAHLRKQAAAEAEGLRWQLDKKDVEILELKKNVKARIEDLSHYKLRLDMAEARVDSAGKQDGIKAKDLEQKLDQLVADLRRKQIEYDETVDEMQKDMRLLKAENETLRDSAKNMSKKALMQGIQTMDALMSNEDTNKERSGDASAHYAIKYQKELKSTQIELARVQNELINLQFRGVLSVPQLVSGPSTMKQESDTDEVLEAIEKEALLLQKEELHWMVFRPDYSRTLPERIEDHKKFREQQSEFYDRVQAVRSRLHQHARHLGRPITRLFATEKKIVKPSTIEEIFERWGIEI